MPLTAMALTLLVVVLRQRVPTSVPSVPVHVQSTSWRVGMDVQLALETEPLHAGQAITLTLLAPGPGQPQVEDLAPEVFGLSGVQILWLPPEHRALEMMLAANAGARYIGLDFEWRQIEPQPGQYVWAGTDEVVALAKRYGLKLAPMLLYTPHWASTRPYAPLDYHRSTPTNYSDYRNFVYAIVSRYKPYGECPHTADGYGITDWIIWNEPNVRSQQEAPEPGDFWTGSLEEYLLLLRAGYEGAHAADPGCSVLNGALVGGFWAGRELDPATALQRFYDPDGDGDASDGGRPFFDTLNIHLYQLGTPDAGWYKERLSTILKVMERFGDEEKPVWITETGYGSIADSSVKSSLVDEQTQADGVRLIYQIASTYPRLEHVFWWSLRDYHANATASNGAMEAHYGLLRANFEPKPAYLAYGQLTGRVGQMLTVSGSTDEKGVAHIEVPASFVTQPGEYVVFIALEGVAPTVVVPCQASSGEGG